MNSLSSLGIHCGLGGFTLGAMNHTNVLGVLEAEETPITRAFRHNAKDVPFWYDSRPWNRFHPTMREATGVTNFIDTTKIGWNLGSLEARVNIVFSCPSSAPFSRMQNSGYIWEYDKRLDLYRSAFSAFLFLRPEAFVLRAVPRILTTGRSLVNLLGEMAARAGYKMTCIKLNASSFGAPQDRLSAFVIFHRHRLALDLLSLREPPSVAETLGNVTHSDDILRTSVSERPSLEKAIGSMLPGDTLRETFDYLYDRGEMEASYEVRKGKVVIKGRPAWGHRRLDKDKQAPPYSGYVWFHPDEDRPLTFEELRALCSYPDSFERPKDFRTSQVMKGFSRSILPYMADIMISLVARSIDRGKKVGHLGPTFIGLSNRKAQVREERLQLSLEFPDV